MASAYQGLQINNPLMTSLNLTSQNINPKNLQPLLDCLKINRTLRELRLNNNFIW